MPSQTVIFGSFAPDKTAYEPGVLVSMNGMEPTDRGYARAREPVNVASVGTLASSCRGAASLTKIDGSVRTFAGTQTKLYELVGTTWTDRSAAGDYSGASAARWSFAQVGDISLATNDTEDIQQTSSGAFAAIANAPKSRIVIAVPNFAVAFNTKNGTASNNFGDQGDRWWCSAYQNPTDWAISAANQCVSERLVGGGEFTAAAPFGNGWVAFKRREMFHAYYTGAAEVFNVQRVPGSYGCVGPDAVADIGNGAKVVVGDNDIYIYDGTRPVSIADGVVRRFFFSSLLRSKQYLTTVRHEESRGLVWIFYPVLFTGGETVDQILVYRVADGRWGIPFSGGFTEAAFVLSRASSEDTIASFNSAQLSEMVGIATTSAGAGFTTGILGSDTSESMVTRVQLLCDTRPGGTINSQLSGYVRSRSGRTVASTVGPVNSNANGDFDFRQSGHWHQFQFALYDDFELRGITIDTEPTGIKR